LLCWLVQFLFIIVFSSSIVVRLLTPMKRCLGVSSLVDCLPELLKDLLAASS
jgi:hypothetical protein